MESILLPCIIYVTSIYFNYNNKSQKNNTFQMNAHEFQIIENNIKTYLLRENQDNILKKIHKNKNIFTELSTYICPIINVAPPLIEKDMLKILFWFLLNAISTYEIKRYIHSENESSIGKKLTNIYTSNLNNDNFIPEKTLFFIAYLKLILIPSKKIPFVWSNYINIILK